jgi:hypothetical protein
VVRTLEERMSPTRAWPICICCSPSESSSIAGSLALLIEGDVVTCDGFEVLP